MEGAKQQVDARPLTFLTRKQRNSKYIRIRRLAKRIEKNPENFYIETAPKSKDVISFSVWNHGRLSYGREDLPAHLFSEHPLIGTVFF
jgi:hypothetical protein